MMYNRSTLVFFLALLLAVVGCESNEEKAEGFYQSAQAYIADNRLDLAVLELKNAAALTPKAMVVFTLLAEVYEKQGEVQEQHFTLQKIIGLDAGNIAARVKLGQLYLANSQLDLALEQSRKLQELASSDVDARVFLGNIMLAISDVEGAQAKAKGVLLEDPEHLGAHILLANVHLINKKYDLALSQLDTALESHSQSALLLTLKINILKLLQRDEDVLPLYSKLMTAFPDNSRLAMMYAKELSQLAQLDQSETFAKTFIQNHPSADAVLNYIELLRLNRGAAVAYAALEQAIQKFPHFVELKLLQADLYMRLGQQDKAKTLYRALLDNADEPTQVAILEVLLGMALTGSTDDEVEGYRQQLLVLDSDNVFAVTSKAKQLLAQRRPEEAVAYLRTVMDDTHDVPEFYTSLGLAHEQQGFDDLANKQFVQGFYLAEKQTFARLESVTVAYMEFLLRHGDVQTAYSLLVKPPLSSLPSYPVQMIKAQVLLKLGYWDEAQALIQNIEKGKGNNAELDYLNGLVLANRKQFEQSIELLKKAQAGASKESAPLMALVNTYLKAGKLAEAEDFLRATIEVSPSSYSARLLLASVLIQRGSITEAEGLYRHLISEYPTQIDAYRNYLRFLLTQGRLDDARQMVDSGLKSLPNNLTLNINKASILEGNGELDAAESIYRSLNQRINSDIVRNNLAQILADSTDKKKQAEALQLAESLPLNQVPEFQDTLGWVYHRQGRHEEAVTLLEKAKESRPYDPYIRYHLGMAYLAQGKRDKAQLELKTCLSVTKHPFRGMDQVKKTLEDL